MVEPVEKEQERKVLKKDEARCPNCGDQVYTHMPTGKNDTQGRKIITCTGCFQNYAME